MFCYNCGAENEKSYCIKCGIYLDDNENKDKSFSYSINKTKFCSACGALTEKSYCCTCGNNSIKQNIDQINDYTLDINTQTNQLDVMPNQINVATNQPEVIANQLVVATNQENSQSNEYYTNNNQQSNSTINNGKSRFVGNPLGILGYNIIGSILAIFLVLVMTKALQSGAFQILIVAPFLGAIIFAFTKFMIVRWEVNNSIVDGEQLRFTGSLGEYIGINIIIFLLNIVTLGFYSFLGFAAAKRMRYKYNHIEGEAYFSGEYYQYFWIKIKMLLLNILLVIVTYSLFKMSSGLGMPTLTDLILNFDTYGYAFVESIKAFAFKNAIIFAFSVFFGTALIYYYQVALMRWEIENVVARGKQWRFTGKIGEVFAINIVFIILNAVTCNLLIILGIQKFLLTKYKVTNIVIEK